ncbi:MAG: virulence factor SrfB, partial [Desulfovibrionaceae bacterium]|nr:virulence factor SrfB [Desulfovibrionaceae bacterium]
FALSRDDLNAASEFLPAWHVRDNSWFVNEQWVDEWVLERYNAGKANTNIRDDEYGKQFCLKHVACYMTWLDAARRAMNDIHVKVTDSNRSDAVDVDLVLDIGNSRTTGILVETSSAKKTDLNDSYLLELRDLTNPNNIYTDPFSTRVEFVDVSFGSDMLSRRSGRRTPAFAWPSCVRVGPEATRLSTYASCAEGNTGMSSPKRYLWDENRWSQSWRYNVGDATAMSGTAEPMVTRGLFPRQLNEEGTPLVCFKDGRLRRLLSKAVLQSQQDMPLFGSFFTRSSLMMFMFAEIVTQALVNINSPASRAKRQLSDKPRHLRRIILTVPTAMPVASRRIFERWVRLAVHLVWNGLGWLDKNGETADGFHYQRQPEILCEWDEASCSHLVLLYNEIMVKHIGDAHQYFSLYGRMRKVDDTGEERPSVRIASIDIGGGTTDLSITTHVLTSRPSETARIRPKVEFRDGFNLAGDEVVRDVIQEVVVHAIEKEMTRLGIEPRNVKLSLFGRYTQSKTEEQRSRQGQFVRQVAVPVALAILEGCERMDRDDNRVYRCTLGDFFEKPAEKAVKGKKSGAAEAPEEPAVQTGSETPFIPASRAARPQARVLNYVQNVFRDCGAREDVDIDAIPIVFSLELISRCISRTLGGTLSSLCEMVHAYDADLLLVTGRPSAWKGIMQTILAMTPLPPSRIIPMRNYHVGSWYPCADLYGCIADPKTTVVVGAILCALSCGYLEGINFDSSNMRMTSTARFVGELNLQGQLEAAKVWFTVHDDGTVEPEEQTITYHSPIVVGYRQLAVDRWPASAYYKLEFMDKFGKGPYKVKLALSKNDDQRRAVGNDDKPPQAEGSIEVLEVSETNGIPVNARSMSATLQTLPTIEGYWLDSGIVVTER